MATLPAQFTELLGSTTSATTARHRDNAWLGRDHWHRAGLPFFSDEAIYPDVSDETEGFYFALAQGAKFPPIIDLSSTIGSSLSNKGFWLLHCPSDTVWEKSSSADRPICYGRISVASGWSKILDRLISDLGRLKAGWDGNGAKPLPQKLLDQLEQVLRLLPQDTQEPEVEVDPSDSSVAVRWWGPQEQSAFAMTFTGNGRVCAVTSCMDEVPPPSWDSEADDETKIIDKVDNPLIRKALAHSS